jgi:allantoinase
MRAMVIRSSRVLLPGGIGPAEIHIEGDRIASVRPYDPDDSTSQRPTLNSQPRPANPVVFPGLIDPHVHVNEPGRTEWEGFTTAAAAAAAGGITTIVDMPLNSIPATTDVRALEVKRAAARASCVNVEFWGGVVPGNAGELDALADAGVRGFKCFLSPSGVEEFTHVTERDLRLALPILARRGLPLLVHAELPDALIDVDRAADPARYATWLASRPPRAEVEAIAMLVVLCREFGARIHVVHVAAADALDLIASAKAEGLPLTAETCPHYLTFCAEEIRDAATQFKCAPPIRERRHRDALWRALDQGVLDFIATDHSPSPPSMKGGDFVGAWGGIASLELSLAAVWTGASARGLAIERLGEWLCAAPARLAGLADRGAIAPGMRADVVEWDPDASFVVDDMSLRQRHRCTPYHGLRLRGRVLRTYVGGRLVYGDAG